MGNLPFGYWRSNVRKFSFQWILAIHIPVIAIILNRIFGNLGFAWYTFIFSVSAFIVGQLLGKVIYQYFKKQAAQIISSCMVMDIFRYCCQNRAS
jgi:hypothetical protein